MTGTTIEFRGVTKRFGEVTAVQDIDFTVQPGAVTGFLGPNGAGKTTSLRILLGLVSPTEGTATFGGTPYRQLARPLATVGTALEAASFHPGRTARNHLRVLAAAAGLPARRVQEAMVLTGIAPAADRRVGGFSMGMRQRLGLAAAMLGDPQVLVLDEPVNGLDPEGIRWLRDWLRMLAREGRTILVSSHLLSEVQQTVDQVVIISGGRIVHTGDLSSLDRSPGVIVDAPDRGALIAALGAAPHTVAADGVHVEGADPAAIGALAQRAGVALSLLTARKAGLEEAFLELVGPDAGPLPAPSGEATR